MGSKKPHIKPKDKKLAKNRIDLEETAAKSEEEMIDEAAEESFPTSDPPAWTLGTDHEQKAARLAEGHELAEKIIKEHEIIKNTVHALTHLIDQLEKDKHLDKAMLTKINEILHRLVDLRHYQKEEIVFSLFKKQDSHPSSYLLNDLRNEHVHGRELIAMLKNHSELYLEDKAAAKDALIKVLKEIQYHYHHHIEKEEEFILPSINKLLTEKQQQSILDQFEKIEEDEQSHDELIEFATMISKKLIK